jgi:acetyl esterase/lipase
MTMRAPWICFCFLLTLMMSGEAAASRWPDGTSVARDLAYGTDPAQRLDVYWLPADATKKPIIVMVHGGAWMSGDKNGPHVVENKVSRWLPRAYVFVSINYRLLPKLDGLLQINDVARALAYVQDHAAEWNGDPGKVILMGHSSGAHLVALLSAAPEHAFVLGARPWPASVSLDSAAMDVVKIMEGKHDRVYDFAFGKDPARWLRASPQQALSAKSVPLLAVCSTQRTDNPCEQARVYAKHAEEVGTKVEILPQDLSHDEIYLKLGEPSPYTAKVEQFMTASLQSTNPAQPR